MTVVTTPKLGMPRSLRSLAPISGWFEGTRVPTGSATRLRIDRQRAYSGGLPVPGPDSAGT